MRYRECARINIEAALRILILLGFAVFFSSLVQSGRIQLYVNPRILPSLKLGIQAMVLIALFTLKDVFRPQGSVRIVPYLFFIIPLILAFLLPARSMNSSTMSLGDIAIIPQGKQSSSVAGPKSVQRGPSVKDGGQDAAEKGSDSDNPGKVEVNSSNYEALASLATQPADRRLKLQNDMVVMDDGNYFRWLKEIYDNMETYRGKKIEVVGFVFKDKQVKANEFVPARLLMTCCTADLQTVGMLCRYDNAKSLARDAWVKVTGTIKIIDYKGVKIPVIVADSIVNADKPENEYVYPF